METRKMNDDELRKVVGAGDGLTEPEPDDSSGGGSTNPWRYFVPRANELQDIISKHQQQG